MTGRRAGAIYFANTAGGVVGSLVAGFVLLPLLGLQSSVSVLVVLAAAALVPLVVADRALGAPSGPGVRISPAVVGALALSIGALSVWLSRPAGFLDARVLPRLAPDERLLSQGEGLNEIVTVTETPGKGRMLMTNGHPMSATYRFSQRYMRAIAHVPLLLADRPGRVLVIGFGVGNTTRAATLQDRKSTRLNSSHT